MTFDFLQNIFYKKTPDFIFWCKIGCLCGKILVLNILAVRTGLEPATPCVTGMYSNQAELPHHFLLPSLQSCSLADCFFVIASAKLYGFVELCKFLPIKNRFSGDFFVSWADEAKFRRNYCRFWRCGIAKLKNCI